MDLSAPESIPLAILQTLCAEQSERFFNHKPSNERYCFEIFRRAIVHDDAQAWELLYRQYRAQMLAWFRRHPLASVFMDDAGYLVQQAFERFWHAMKPEKFAAFAGIPAILQYLKMCVHATLIDAMRARQLSQHLQTETTNTVPPLTINTPEKQAIQREQAENLWRWAVGICKDERERTILHETYVLGMSAAETFAQHPELFEDIQTVYRVKENLLARLRRQVENAPVA
ncbi:MAG: sigma-70 family RNA polymerase sigma factor [Anaerolineales bacterium]